jgi:hypothetical protein
MVLLPALSLVCQRAATETLVLNARCSAWLPMTAFTVLSCCCCHLLSLCRAVSSAEAQVEFSVFSTAVAALNNFKVRCGGVGPCDGLSRLLDTLQRRNNKSMHS